MSDWTFETFKTYIDQRFDDQDKAVQAALASAEKAVNAALIAAKEAVTKAEISNGKEFEAANNIKATFSAELATKMGRDEYIIPHKALEDKLNDLTDRINRSEGQNKGSELTKTNIIAYLMVAGTILGVIILWANHSFK